MHKLAQGQGITITYYPSGPLIEYAIREGWDLDAFDSTPVLIHDAPRPDEIVLWIGYATGPRVIRMIPPLIIGKAEVDRAVDILSQCLDLVLTHAPGDGPRP